MAYKYEKDSNDIVIDGWEKGIAQSPYEGIANIRNLNTTYYPGVTYLNYRRRSATVNAVWYAGSHSTNVSNNTGWEFVDISGSVMANPVEGCTSPAGLNYILDSSGQVWKQNSVNSTSFTIIGPGTGRIGTGNTGIAYWNNYIVVFGGGLIETCGDGTGDAGITSSNWNKSTNFTVLGNVTWTVRTFQCTAAILTGATTATLSATWPYPTNTSATFIFSNGESRTGTVTNGGTGLSWTGATTSDSSSLVFISSPGISMNTNQAISVGDQITFSSSGTLPAGLTAGTIYYATVAPSLAGGTYNFSVSATQGGTAITFNDQGTGTLKLNKVTSVTLPLGNVTGLTFTTDLQNSNTSATISSYTLPNGTSVTSYWALPTGIYNIVDSNGNNVLATFTFGSSSVTFPSPIIAYATGTFSVKILNTSVTSCRAYTSKVDGNLYFINGQSMGAIIIAESNTLFTPSNALGYTVQYSVFELSTGANQGIDSITDMIDLQTSMVVAGNKDVYTWDYVSSFTSAPVPIGEPIKRLSNTLNNVYVFAGQKGSIYVSNGAYAQYLTKIPDYIAGAIDPVWTFGDVMTKRSRIYFTALAQDTSGNNLIAGVFAMTVSPALLGDISAGIVMDAQYSSGLIPASGATGASVLIDNQPSSSGQNSYYSAYSTGASSGAIDYNDTSVWQSNEPVIETDIIPIGTFLMKKSLGQIQFKLDRPMASGDSISLYWRPSLTDSYTLIGTTSSTVLSDIKPTNINQAQWAQFKITFSGASSNSSRIPLREVRIQIK